MKNTLHQHKVKLDTPIWAIDGANGQDILQLRTQNIITTSRQRRHALRIKNTKHNVVRFFHSIFQ